MFYVKGGILGLSKLARCLENYSFDRCTNGTGHLCLFRLGKKKKHLRGAGHHNTNDIDAVGPVPLQ